MLLVHLGIIAVTICNAIVMAHDYCSPYLCDGYGNKHIGCDNDGDFSSKCPDDRLIIKMTNNIKDFILNKHNQLRSKVAMGLIDGYESADSMSQMIWDDELANLAEMNVKKCKFGHDKCFKTDNFPLAGQNLYEIRSISKFKWNSFNEAIDYFIDRWFNEYKNADMNVISRYRSNGRKIAHFTQIVSSESTKVGCGMIRYKNNRSVTVYFVCNYSQSSIMNAPIYTTGKPCSKCDHGCSKKYPGLCRDCPSFTLLHFVYFSPLFIYFYGYFLWMGDTQSDALCTYWFQKPWKPAGLRNDGGNTISIIPL